MKIKMQESTAQMSAKKYLDVIWYAKCQKAVIATMLEQHKRPYFFLIWFWILFP